MDTSDEAVMKMMERLHLLEENTSMAAYTYEHPDYGRLITEVPERLQPLLSTDEDHDNLPPQEEIIASCSELDHDTLASAVSSIIYFWLDRWHRANDNDEESGVWLYPIHLAILLAEKYGLRECLPALLEIERQDREFAEMCFDDSDLTGMVAACIYRIVTEDNLPLLASFAREHGIHSFCKAEVIAAVATLPRREPQLLPKVQQWFFDLLSVFADDIDPAVGDVLLLEAIVHCCIHTRCEAAKPMIIRMYSKYKMPNILIPGGANEVRKTIKRADIGVLDEYKDSAETIYEFRYLPEELDDDDDYDDENYDDEEFDDDEEEYFDMEKNETLEDLMLEFDFGDLLENAEIMGYNENGEMEYLDEEGMASYLANAVLNDPQQVLRRLPFEDLELLQMLKNEEPGMGMKAWNTTQCMAMCSLGLARETEWDKEKDIYMIYITEDFRNAILPHIDKVLEDFDVKFRIYVERFIVGALNIYGLLTVKELKKILKQCMDLTDDGSGVYNHIYGQSIVLQINECYDDDNKAFYTSPFVHDHEAIIKVRKEHPELKKPKQFDREIIRAAGEMPVPAIPNPYTDKLMDCFTNKLGFTDQEAYFQMFMAWRMAQEKSVSPVGIVQHIIDESGKVSGIDMLNEVMGELMNYLNAAPRWGFYGHSPNDLQKKMGPMTAPPRISLEPNARKMGYTQEQAQQIVDDLWEERRNPARYDAPFDTVMPYIATPKVGRNDPCPCGSGKKFKNCCGRGN